MQELLETCRTGRKEDNCFSFFHAGDSNRLCYTLLQCGVLKRKDSIPYLHKFFFQLLCRRAPQENEPSYGDMPLNLSRESGELEVFVSSSRDEDDAARPFEAFDCGDRSF